MSSVSNSDRANYDERVRDMKEDYEQREAENAKRRARDLKRIQQKHDEEVAAVREDFDRRLADIRSRSKEGFSEQEMDHQKKIEEVRELYKEQLRKKAEENEFNIREWRKATEGEKAHKSRADQNREQHYMEQHQKELAKKDEVFSRAKNQYDESLDETVSDNRRKLLTAHEREIQALNKSWQNDKERAELDKEEMRKAYGSTIGQKEQELRYKDAYWNNRFQDLATKEAAQEEGGETQSQLLQSENARIQKRFREALDKRSEQMGDTEGYLRNSLEERVNSQVRSKQSEIERLKGKLNNTITTDRRLREVERRNLINDYEEKLKMLGKNNEENKEVLMELSQDRIEKALEKKESASRLVDRDHRERMAHMRTEFRDGLDAIEQHRNHEVERVKGQADRQVEIFQNKAANETKMLNQFQYDSLESLKDNYSERLTQEREFNASRFSKMNRDIQEKFKNSEEKFTRRLDNTVRDYEARLENMRYNHQKDMQSLKQEYDRRLKAKDKGTDLEKDTLVTKYEQKIAQLNDQHDQNLERVRDRHREDVTNLTKRVSYQRKA